MASVATVNLSANQVGGVIEKAYQGSALAQITQAQPQTFGSVDYVTLTGTPKAQVVGAGEAKKGNDLGTTTLKAEPIKLHISQRFQDEADWQDQDYRLHIMEQFEQTLAVGLARGVDIVAIHGKSPIDGSPVTRMPNPAVKSTLSAEYASDETGAYNAMLAANRLLLNGSGIASAAAFDPRFLGALAGEENKATGEQRFPELGFGAAVSSFKGLPLGVSDTVSAVQEFGDSRLRAVILGSGDVFRWGVQKSINMERHVSGDPDNSGRDLAGHNEFLLRSEVVFSAAWTDLSKVVLVKQAAAA